MLELTKKENDLNSIGMLCGLYMGAIPFYNLYKTFKSVSLLKKLSTNLLIKVIISALTILAVNITFTFYIIRFIKSAYTSIYMDDYESFITTIIIFAVILIVAGCIGGFTIKTALEEDVIEDGNIRFDLACLSGTFLRMIPLYIIVKSSRLKDIVSLYKGEKQSFIFVYVVYFGKALLKGVLSIIASFVQFVLHITIGLELAALKDDIINSELIVETVEQITIKR